MTFIAKPVIDDSEVLNHIGRDLLIEQNGETKLKRALKVVTSDGVVHEISFAQADGLLNILDSTRETPPCSPLQYLIDLYKIDDLVALGKEGWIVPSYEITVLHEPKTVRFEGRLSRVGSVDKEFTFALGGFDFIQQLSMARCIAGISAEFKPVVGTFDVSYRFITGEHGVKITTALGI